MAAFIVSIDLPAEVEGRFFRGVPGGVRLLHREPHEGGALLALAATDAFSLMELMALCLGAKATDREVDDFIDARVREVACDPTRLKLVILDGRLLGYAGSWTEAARVARAATGGRLSELASEAPNAFHFAEA
jgi:hypothetical protein